VTDRLEILKKELEKGRQRLDLLDRERQEVRDTMLRISGAIQVLEELLSGKHERAPEEELVAVGT
jgi:hypothetical protein